METVKDKTSSKRYLAKVNKPALSSLPDKSSFIYLCIYLMSFTIPQGIVHCFKNTREVSKKHAQSFKLD